MRMPLSIVFVACATLLVLTSGAIGAEEQASADPAASTTEQVGPISWKRDKTAKGFAGDAHVSDILQHAGADTFLCGVIADQQGLPKAALWSSTNATRWKPVRWDAPDGSSCSGLVSWSGGITEHASGHQGTSATVSAPSRASSALSWARQNSRIRSTSSGPAIRSCVSTAVVFAGDLGVSRTMTREPSSS